MCVKNIFIPFCLILNVLTVFGQKVEIVLGPDEVGENQAWTLSVTIANDRLRSYDNFPDIDGFRKRGTSSQQSTSIINGQISSSQSVTMTYLPTKQGTFVLPAFKMKINDQFVSSPGKKIKVEPPVTVHQRDPFRNFFDRDDANGREETEFVDVKDDAFLAVTTNKDDVYVGEGFNTTLSFYTSESNRAPMSWYKLSEQLSDILKKVKPANCWEENFNIENIEGEVVSIGGKRYTQYKIYQATFYPLNEEPIVFPKVGLEMIKYKVAKNPSFFGQNRQEDFKTFYTKLKKINVKPLPPHPLKDVVAVGDYYLEERIPNTDLQTGKSASYDFNIYGEGNISSLTKPEISKDGNFEFYEPNVRQNINHQNNRVTGTKSFSYFMIPGEPGEYRLGDYFHWVFFNPSKKRYDTLRSKLTVFVTGESRKNEAILSTDVGVFYDKINDTDNQLHTLASVRWAKTLFNIFIFAMFGASAYLVFKKK